VHPKIPIVKIDKNDKVIIEAYAILGRAKDHAKWQAVSNVAFRYFPVIDFNEKDITDPEMISLIVRMCPEDLYIAKNENHLELKEDYWKTCTLCKACESNSIGKIKVSYKKGAYIFTIETDGVLPLDVLMKETFKIFDGKIEEFITKLEELEIES
jgi:DNA-directed RNA polymerase subunit D